MIVQPVDGKWENPRSLGRWGSERGRSTAEDRENHTARGAPGVTPQPAPVNRANKSFRAVGATCPGFPLVWLRAKVRGLVFIQAVSEPVRIAGACRIVGRISTYTIYRVALTMNLLFVVVLASIFLGFAPLTALVIVVMSLFDDVPIMTIAYDNAAVAA